MQIAEMGPWGTTATKLVPQRINQGVLFLFLK
jgi:hypothetical protein